MVTLFAVNPIGQEIARPVDLTVFGARGQEAEVWTLADQKHAGEPDVSNDFGEPDRVSPVKAVFHAASGKFTYSFPPYSLTVLRWKVSP